MVLTAAFILWRASRELKDVDPNERLRGLSVRPWISNYFSGRATTGSLSTRA